MWQLPETLNVTITLFKVASSKSSRQSQAGHVTKRSASTGAHSRGVRGQRLDLHHRERESVATAPPPLLPLAWPYSACVSALPQESRGRTKVLASASVNMKQFASASPAQYDITLQLKPASAKVLEASLKLRLSCVFLKEGKAT